MLLSFTFNGYHPLAKFECTYIPHTHTHTRTHTRTHTHTHAHAHTHTRTHTRTHTHQLGELFLIPLPTVFPLLLCVIAIGTVVAVNDSFVTGMGFPDQ